MNIKETKKDAKLKLSGKWPKVFMINLIYLAIMLALQYGVQTLLVIFKNVPIAKLTLSLISLAVTLPLSYGIISTLIDISRDKAVKYTDFINKTILNFSKVWAVAFKIFLKLIIPITICFVVFFVFIFICAAKFGITDETLITYEYIIATAYIIIMTIFFVKFLPYALSFMVLADNPNMPAKDIILKSASLMQNKKFEYFLLCLSFIGWIFVIAIIAFFANIIIKSPIIIEIIVDIGILILSPYIITSQITYYENINSEIEENKEKE